MYGSPQLGPFRESRQRQSCWRRVGGAITLEPLWSRVVPWQRARGFLRSMTLLVWIVVVLVLAPPLVRTVSDSGLGDNARSLLHLEATPTFTAQQQAYVAVSAQQQLAQDPVATPVPTVRISAEVALVSSACQSGGQPPLTTCRGTIRNIAGETLSGVQVEIGWSATRDGPTQIKTSASIDFDPLLPDQSSNWTVVGRYNDVMRWYHVELLDGTGRRLTVRDDRPTPTA